MSFLPDDQTTISSKDQKIQRDEIYSPRGNVALGLHDSLHTVSGLGSSPHSRQMGWSSWHSNQKDSHTRASESILNMVDECQKPPQGCELDSVSTNHDQVRCKRGWGAMINHVPYPGLWDQSIRGKSSNFRELKAVEEALLAASRQISGQQIYSDMTSVAHIKHQGSTKFISLKKISAQIFCWAEKHLLSLMAIHLKGAANIQADYLSRQDIHPGEWSLDHQTFNMLVRKWCLPEVDLFASLQNAKVETFFSLNPRGNPRGVDALVQDCHFHLAYAFPPIPILAKVLRKIQIERTPTILIAPLWPKRSWFNLIIQLQVGGPVMLLVKDNLLSQGPILLSGRRHTSEFYGRMRGAENTNCIRYNDSLWPSSYQPYFTDPYYTVLYGRRKSQHAAFVTLVRKKSANESLWGREKYGLHTDQQCDL
ncbi:uncharacterized protein [Ranitomeya imitator]|uniref:uncharacterized protein n=1 Tax=Ranitomeya imitator TaxID=111125 RepID=UPI0037E9221F